VSKSILAGVAFAAVAAIAMPVLSWPSGEAAAQTPPTVAPAQPGAGGHGGQGRHRHMAGTPQQRCEAHIAHATARVGDMGTKLNLTPDQQPLFAKLQSAVQASADKEHQLCAGLPAPGQQAQRTILDRLSQREQFMQARLQAMQQVQPALQALYQALTPAQKAVIDHPMHRS
jgi:hypothetical protein